MTEIKDLTDAELVEAVAREVLRWKTGSGLDLYMQNHPELGILWEDAVGKIIRFDPFHDMNDLFMVLEKFEAWEVGKDWDGNHCAVWDNQKQSSKVNKVDIVRAVLEAVLEARRKG